MYLCNPRAGGKERKEENLSRKGMIQFGQKQSTWKTRKRKKNGEQL